MDRFQTNNTLIHTDFTHTFFTCVSCCVSYLTLLVANIVLDFPLETTCSCKRDKKERYWGQQFWQMERHISVRPTEMTRPVTVDHLQSWFRIFRSDQTEMVRSI